MQTILNRHWCHLPADEVARLLETDVDSGLDIFAVQRRQERLGLNVLKQRRTEGSLVRFLRQFHNPLVYLLLAAGVVAGALGEWVDAGVILGVVLVNAVIGFVQEAKAVKAIQALSSSMTSETMVVRAGERRRLSSRELVPGDVVLLQSGDRVPADLRLVRARDLNVAEAALTGEAVPVVKKTDPVAPDTVLAERWSMAYMSTLVTGGTGRGIVVGTGDGTEIGRISELIATAEVLATPLTRKIARFSGILLYVIVGLALLTFVVGALRGDDWMSTFMASVALAVGAIPEGLPAALTITLAIGVARMARHNAIIRRLPAVETLGSTTVICSDKTGTLTQNQMTVQSVFAGGEDLEVTGTGYAPVGTFRVEGEDVKPGRDSALLECLKAGLLCNDSSLSSAGHTWRVEGDPTEGALISAARKYGLDPTAIDDELPRLDVVPFESEHQCMATLHRHEITGTNYVYLKGSLETLLPRCSFGMQSDGRSGELNTEAIQTKQESMAAGGLRVLAFARTETPDEKTNLAREDLRDGLIFLGLQGMMDPPRPEAIEAVRACQRAAIKVKMITGDHGGTALSVGRQIGLGNNESTTPASEILTGSALAKLTDAELIDAAENTDIFARVTPEQKLRLVQALQANEHVVAMTGDGVNDAPALRRADIGIAMGITGTEVAKEAADMVLSDDNFATIAVAVEEGRGVYDNIIKFITWTLPTNLGEGLVILAAVLAGATLPILPVQILWINMTTAVLLGLTLAFEPKEPGIMTRSPREPKTPILTGALLFRIVLVGLLLLAGSFGLFHWQLELNATEAEARTVAVNVFVVGAVFYLFNCRSLTRSMFAVGLLSNLWLLGGVAITLGLQLAFTYVPFMNRLFQSSPIDIWGWAAVFAVGFGVYVITGFEKWLRRLRATARTGT